MQVRKRVKEVKENEKKGSRGFEGKRRRSLESARSGKVHHAEHQSHSRRTAKDLTQLAHRSQKAPASNHRKEQEPPEPLLPQARLSQSVLVGYLCLRQLWEADLTHNCSFANNHVQPSLHSISVFPATYIVLFVLPCRSSKMLSRAVRPALSVGNATLARYRHLLDFSSVHHYEHPNS